MKCGLKNFTFKVNEPILKEVRTPINVYNIMPRFIFS